MTDVFISYKREDRPRCARIAEKLRGLGLNVWFDAQLESGSSFDAEIEARVHAAKAVLVLWSQASVQSTWVRNEATIGAERGVLVSAEIEPCRRPIQFTTTHTVPLHAPDFADDDPAWLSLVSRIGKLTGRPDLAARGGSFDDGANGHAPKKKRVSPLVFAGFAAVVVAAGIAGVWMMGQPTPPAARETNVAAAPSTGAPQAPVSAPPADPCASARGDWESLAQTSDGRLLKAFLDRTPADCAIQRGLAEARIATLAKAGEAEARRQTDAQAITAAFRGEWVDVPGQGGECGRLPWRFERTGAGYDRISRGGDREPFAIAGANPPTLRHSGGLKIVSQGARLAVIPPDDRARCLLQRN